MRTNRKVTAVLLVAALAGAGCSESKKSLPEKVEAADAPVSATNELSRALANNKTSEETTKPVGPVTFADGEAAYQAGNYSEATRIFDQYVTEKPGNAWGHFMLGLSAWKSGDPSKAEVGFNEALRIDPKHMKSLVNLSRVLIEQGRSDDALEKLTLASEIDPKSAEVHRLLGRTYTAQGKIDDAVMSYRSAIALDGKDAWSMNNLGFLLLEQGRAGDALPLLARAVQLRKDVPVFHNNLGMALEHTGRFTAATAEYNSALAADAGYVKAKQNLERVQAVKVNSEEPFDLEATARSVGGEEKPTPVNEVTTAARQ